MTHAVPDILARILQQKEVELSEAKTPLPELEKRAADRIKERRSFAKALASDRPAIIAEIKKASPSKGLLCADFRPAEIAASYESGGAAALSVLTDSQFFLGSLADLEVARAAVQIPVLRKDFTTCAYHVVEAAAHGADAILLIVAALSSEDLVTLRELAESLRLDTLVEVHDGEELERALDSGARIIGVNNRDLRTFHVSLETSLRLAPKIPEAILKVSESGVRTSAHIRELTSAGFHAFLVGEHLMKSRDPKLALASLLALESSSNDG